MGQSNDFVSRIVTISILGIMLFPMIAVAIPISNGSSFNHSAIDDSNWWESNSMDYDGDYIHDAIWLAPSASHHDYLDENGKISVIVDFDHTPTLSDQIMLETQFEFETQFRYWLIDSIAGRIELTKITELIKLPEVVFIELDGRLEIAMNDVKPAHGVDLVWADTGYTGAGSAVAIIDTGIDGNHSGLDDLDDDNSTNDAKIIGFYDAVNSPELTNGTEVQAYDDQGHGTHCAGITAGTGAPTYEYIGVAPQANLVGVKVLDAGGSGSYATVMAGMQWTVDMRHTFNIRAASMSLGGPGLSEWTSSEEESVNRMANEMMRAGIALFIAAGNSAFSAQIGTPGSAEDVITVGALDKDTGIAVYSSQGPTEEGRIKPNIAFVGSSVMAPDYNTGTGYTAKSGTSMATPGAAGVAALMYQANPDLSPFDVRNIMQETATYRRCEYMLKNEPCAEDLIPKNRQNNVYGHGHVNAQPSVEEAANQVYELSMSLNITLQNEFGDDNRVHIEGGEAVSFHVEGGAMVVQWRTWDMRDNWMNLEDFNPGEENFEVSHALFIDRLQYLPNNTIEGDQVLLVRAIKADQASTNVVVKVHIMGGEDFTKSASTSMKNALIYGVIFLITIILLSGVGLVGFKISESGYFESEVEFEDYEFEAEDDEVVESLMADTDPAIDDD